MLIKIPLFLPVNDENSFNQIFFLVRRQSGRVKRHAYSYVFLLRPPLPKARSRGGRQFFAKEKEKIRIISKSLVSLQFIFKTKSHIFFILLIFSSICSIFEHIRFTYHVHVLYK